MGILGEPRKQVGFLREAGRVGRIQWTEARGKSLPL